MVSGNSSEMENPKEAAKKFIRPLHRQYDSVASKQIQCAQCKIKPGVNFCGGECGDANVRYCSQMCANLHWSDHMCLIAGKRDREENDLPSDEEEQKKRNMVSHGEMLYTGVLPQNEAFYQALIDGLTIEQVTQYSLVSDDFRNQIVHNPLFWFLFLKKHVPFCLLVLHARAAKSNNVSIDARQNNVDYERFGLEVLRNVNGTQADIEFDLEAISQHDPDESVSQEHTTDKKSVSGIMEYFQTELDAWLFAWRHPPPLVEVFAPFPGFARIAFVFIMQMYTRQVRPVSARFSLYENAQMLPTIPLHHVHWDAQYLILKIIW
jgi:hypothetical protein